MRASGGPGGMAPKWRCSAVAGGFDVDVAGQYQGRVVGAVVGSEPFVDVVQAGRVQILHGADYRPGIGMSFGEDVFRDVGEGLAVGLVLALALFVLHHAALFVQLLLVDGAEQVPHAVGFQPKGQVQGAGGHRLEVVCAVVVGGAVDAGDADLLQRFEILGVVVLAAVEHQVLEQVRETGLAGVFVSRTDVIPERDGDDGRLAVFVDDDSQPVVEVELLVRDIDVGGLRECAAGKAQPSGTAKKHDGWSHDGIPGNAVLC